LLRKEAMMSERDDQLREMARHRGFKLVKSRRRKAGGDFGLYGLTDAKGAAVFGVEGKTLTASDAEIEGFLRKGARSDWAAAAKAVKARPRPVVKEKPAPKPKPKPRFKPKVANLLEKLPAAKRAEAFTELLARPGVKLERIVSNGQATPEDAPMVQDADEWVVVLQGAAGMRIEDSAEVTLGPGDHLLIAAGQKHWVTWTAKDRATVWLAVHLG
jgi:mannose-6-phosphate isomerase-like protein (cupin superfamily)